eukprot:scaffold243473_cov26-Tisochrysis_lutea.AAC.6
MDPAPCVAREYKLLNSELISVGSACVDVALKPSVTTWRLPSSPLNGFGSSHGTFNRDSA